MKSKNLEKVHNKDLKLKGRPYTDYLWSPSIDEITIPMKLAFKVDAEILDISASKVIWDFGDNTKLQTVTNRKCDPLETEITHIFRVQNIEDNETLNIYVSVFTEDQVMISKEFIIHTAKHRQSTNYVDPIEFRDQIVEYYKTGIIPDKLATAIQEIATRLSFRPNFINYTYREEMVGDALVKMVKALVEQKFDPKKGNPFSYFTKIAFHAFCKRIKGEKKQRQTITEYQDEVYEALIHDGLVDSSFIRGNSNENE